MKRGRSDKTSVRGIDFPFLAVRSNRKVTRSHTSKYLRNLTSYKFSLTESGYNTFICELRKLCELPYFFGYMTAEEIDTQRALMDSISYFVCISDQFGGFMCQTCTAHASNLTYIGVLNFASYGNALHRSQGLIFQKKLRKRIDCWGIIGKRLRVVRDVRIIISKIIWNGA